MRGRRGKESAQPHAHIQEGKLGLSNMTQSVLGLGNSTKFCRMAFIPNNAPEDNVLTVKAALNRFFKKFNCVCVCVFSLHACLCLCTMCTPGAQEGQGRSDSLNRSLVDGCEGGCREPDPGSL